MSISIIGIGRLGGALALALAEKGFEIENLLVRKRETAERIAGVTNSNILSDEEFEKISSEIILITTQDAEIPNVAENLAGKLKVKTDCSAYERFAFVGRFTQTKGNRLCRRFASSAGFDQRCFSRKSAFSKRLFLC